MNRILIECDGITLGKYSVPPFTLRAGEVVCWQMPAPAYSELERLAIKTLIGEYSLRGLNVSAKVLLVDPGLLSIHRRWQRLAYLFHRPLLVNRLAKIAGISKAQAENIADRHGVRRDIRVGSLSNTPRVLLVLESAWARGAQVVVFSTVGCDPPGITAIYGEIATHLDDCAGIELCYPVWTQGRQVRQWFPGATCVELTAQKKISTISSQTSDLS
jgi:hypothetical protein